MTFSTAVHVGLLCRSFEDHLQGVQLTIGFGPFLQDILQSGLKSKKIYDIEY